MLKRCFGMAAPMARAYWLMKSEPDVYSIEDLEADGKTHWDGVRNHQAKLFMRDKMTVGDRVLFYHSNASPPGVAGVAEVVRKGYPDHTAWDPKDPHYDPRSTKEEPVWYMVDVGFVERFDEPVALDEVKADPSLEGMYVRKRGMRLSIHPVERGHFERIVQMGRMRSKKGEASKQSVASGAKKASKKKSAKKSAEKTKKVSKRSTKKSSKKSSKKPSGNNAMTPGRAKTTKKSRKSTP